MIIYNAKILYNKPVGTLYESIVNNTGSIIQEWSSDRLAVDFIRQNTSFENIAYKLFAKNQEIINGHPVEYDVISIDTNWYRNNLTPLCNGFDTSIVWIEKPEYKGTVQGLFSWSDGGMPCRIEMVVADDNSNTNFKNQIGYYETSVLMAHELSHNFYFINGQPDLTHHFHYETPQGLRGAYENLNYDLLNAKLVERRKTYQTINPLRGDNMILVKANGNPTVYALMQDTLVGFVDMNTYNKFIEGRNVQVVSMDPAEIGKFKISPVVMKL